MFQLIGVPLDGTSHAEAAIPVAVRLARLAHARLQLMLAHRPSPVMIGGGEIAVAAPDLEGLAREQEAAYLARVSERLLPHVGASVRAVHTTGSPGPALCEAIEHTGVDLVVMASHGRRGLRRMWLGSVAEFVIRHGGAPVLVLGPGSARAPLTESRTGGVLVAVDFSPESEAVLQPAADLARLLRQHITLIHIVVPGTSADSSRTGPVPEDKVLLEIRQRDAARRLDAIAEDLRRRGCSVSARVRVGADPAVSILDLLEKDGFDGVAVGTRGAGAMKRLFVGSVATGILRSAPVPVLVVHRS